MDTNSGQEDNGSGDKHGRKRKLLPIAEGVSYLWLL